MKFIKDEVGFFPDVQGSQAGVSSVEGSGNILVNGLSGVPAVGSVVLSSSGSLVGNYPPTIKYVNADVGNDATGDGSIASPYLTIQAALAAITDASPTKSYLVSITSDISISTDIVLKPYVGLVGEGGIFALKGTGELIVDASLNTNSAKKLGVSNLILEVAVNIDLTTINLGTQIVLFKGCEFKNSTTFRGRNSTKTIFSLESCSFNDFYTGTSIVNIRNSVINGGLSLGFIGPSVSMNYVNIIDTTLGNISYESTNSYDMDVVLRNSKPNIVTGPTILQYARLFYDALSQPASIINEIKFDTISLITNTDPIAIPSAIQAAVTGFTPSGNVSGMFYGINTSLERNYTAVGRTSTVPNVLGGSADYTVILNQKQSGTDPRNIYNTSNGRTTAKVEGVYLFDLNIRLIGVTDSLCTDLKLFARLFDQAGTALKVVELYHQNPQPNTTPLNGGTLKIKVSFMHKLALNDYVTFAFVTFGGSTFMGVFGDNFYPTTEITGMRISYLGLSSSTPIP